MKIYKFKGNLIWQIEAQLQLPLVSICSQLVAYARLADIPYLTAASSFTFHITNSIFIGIGCLIRMKSIKHRRGTVATQHTNSASLGYARLTDTPLLIPLPLIHSKQCHI